MVIIKKGWLNVKKDGTEGRPIYNSRDRHMSKTELDSESWPLNASNNENPNRNGITYITGFLSSRPNWVTPTPSPARECCSSPLWFLGGRHTRLRGRGWGDPIPPKGQTLWHSLYTILYGLYD